MGYIPSPLTTVNKIYLYLLKSHMFRNSETGNFEKDIYNDAKKIENPKLRAVPLFDHLEEVILFALNFDLLGHYRKKLPHFSELSASNASVYEGFHFNMKKFIKMT